MQTLHQICDNCDSDFTIKYDEESVEDSPQFCPFCGEILIDFEKIEDEDD